jgi:molecular chaperone DnaJ
MRRDYYAVLGITAGATPQEIRRAYQRLARQYSPDVNLWEQEARALFEEIAEAYRVLGDPLARGLYDRVEAGRRERSSPPEAARPGGRRGDDLHLPVELSFDQAVTGLEADLTVERLSPCGRCGATGTAQRAVPAACGHCAGTGSVWRGPGALEAGPCPACQGAGVRVTDPCASCRGRGVTPGRAAVHVTLPPGADTGAQFRFPGQGHSGPFGGPRGDLVVITRVREDPLFTRKGDNVYCEVPLTVVEAALGTRVAVTALDGGIDLLIPPGTQSGQVFRVRGRGMPRLSSAGRGDLYVTVRVEIPRDLDARGQELLRELGRLLPDTPREGTGRRA